MNLEDLETPAAILELPKLKANAQRMIDQGEQLGVIRRPHVKTLKSIEAAKIYARDTDRITVSTLLEAEAFAKAGYKDILYGVGIAPNKLDRVAKMIQSGVDLTLMIDNIKAAEIVSAYAEKVKVSMAAMIEVDVDGHRAGIHPDSEELLDVAAALTRDGHARLRGIAAHAGSSYGCKTLDDVADLAEVERVGSVKAATRLREAGYEVPDISVGSTPTALYARNLDGVTELRAGVYATFDLVMAGVGVCDIDDIALSILCSVIGHQEDKGWIIVDAGWMAMSRDRGTQAQKVDQLYGVVCDIHGEVMDDLILKQTNQEQGIIVRKDGKPISAKDYPYGHMFRILPNHACATGGQHNKYLVVDDSTKVVDEWERLNAW
ncbi:MAG: alanine racemase [Pseudomonadota bacterium]